MSLISITNELIIKNLDESIKFYQDMFDFEIEDTSGNPINWVQLKKDNIRIMLEDYKNTKELFNNKIEKTNSYNQIILDYDTLKEAKEIYKKLKDNNIEFFVDYYEAEYGKAEFGIYDPDRNMILVSALIK